MNGRRLLLDVQRAVYRLVKLSDVRLDKLEQHRQLRQFERQSNEVRFTLTSYLEACQEMICCTYLLVFMLIYGVYKELKTRRSNPIFHFVIICLVRHLVSSV